MKRAVSPPKKNQDGSNVVFDVKISHDWLLPHVKNRPLSLVRCPDGVAGECFYQRHLAMAARRGSLQTVKRERSSKGAYVYAASLDAVVSAVQNGAVEFHTWGATVPDIKQPDRITMDLDPDHVVAPIKPELEWEARSRGGRGRGRERARPGRWHRCTARAGNSCGRSVGAR